MLIIVTALDEYIVFANQRTCLSDGHRWTDIHNGNIDIDTKNNMFIRTYMAIFDASAFGAAGNSDMKKRIFQLNGCW